MNKSPRPHTVHDSVWAQRQAIRHTADVTGVTLLCYMGLSALLPLLLNWLAPTLGHIHGRQVWVAQLHREFIAALSYGGSLLIPFVFMWKSLGLGQSSLPRARRADAPYLLAALFVGTGAASLGNILSYLAQLLLECLGYGFRDNSLHFADTAPANVVLVLCSTLIAALVEELAFRGVLLRALRRYGDRFGILCSALIFALCHSSPMQFAPALLSGLVLACLTVRTGSLGTGILVHMAYNALAILINQISVNFLPSARELFSLLVGGLLTICGIIFGVYLYRRDHKSRPNLHKAPSVLTASEGTGAFLSSIFLWVALILIIVRQLDSIVPLMER